MPQNYILEDLKRVAVPTDLRAGFVFPVVRIEELIKVMSILRFMGVF